MLEYTTKKKRHHFFVKKLVENEVFFKNMKFLKLQVLVQKNPAVQKKIPLSLDLPTDRRFGVQLTASLPYSIVPLI